MPCIEQDERWLVARFAVPQRVASWAVVGGGLRRTQVVAWRYVRREELPLHLDAVPLFRGWLAERGLEDAVGLLTARELRHFVEERACSGELEAGCIATVGLGNALRTGDPAAGPAPVGTINQLCWLSAPLTDEALLEALALAAEARSAALVELRVPSGVSGRPASGTGTDCIVVAAPADGPALAYVGKHTLAGELLGRVVERAILRASQAWLAQHGPR